MFDKLVEKKILTNLEFIEKGSIHFTTPQGRTYHFQGRKPGCEADIHIHDWKVISRLIAKGDVGLAEDFKNGLWQTNNLVKLLTFGLENDDAINNRGNWLFKQASKLLYWQRLNSLRGSKKNISAHYDLGNNFYQLWLDPTMSYSSGIYLNHNDSLKQAQLNKYDRILSRLDVQDNTQLLEIGCGWGGFAQRLMQMEKKVSLKGITLSKEQHHYANSRLKDYPLSQISIQDYRHEERTFDYIVSIEMLEAVGKKYWATYFEMLKSTLKKKGKAIIQSITVTDHLFDTYEKSADMIRTYIFPGGLLPSQERLMQSAKNANLHCTDVFAFGQDYAKTLDVWLETFNQNHARIKDLGYDEKFMRLWQFYLSGCIATFKTGKTNVVQMELQHA